MGKGDVEQGGIPILIRMPKIGTVRTMCMMIIAFGVLILFVNIYSEQYKIQLCSSQRRLDDPSVQLLLRRDTQNATSQDSLWDYDWDMRAGENRLDALGSIPDRTLILVRHGKYDLSTGKLTQLGQHQANLTGQRLKEMNLAYDEIIHSTMDRAVETAQIIHSHLPNLQISSDEMLIEGGPAQPHPTITYWSLPIRAYHLDGPRMEAAFRKYFYRPDTSLKKHTFQILVGHGNIFRFFALRALQFPKQAWMRLFIAHASITQITIRGDGTVSISKLGDAGHFPHDKVTY